MALRGNSLSDLDAILKQVADAVQRDVNQLVADITVNVAHEVAKRTPVDTGYARANWITTLENTYDVHMPYKMFPSRWRRNRRGNFGAGGSFRERTNVKGVTEQARAAVIHRDDEHTVYIVNNVPYTPALNKGHSTQAPANFVRAGVNIGVALAVRKFKFNHLRKMNPRTPRKRK